MRNMSFALTVPQILDRSKTVTRRIGWKFLRGGETILPVRQCQGLKKGQTVEALGCPIRVVSVRLEWLRAMTDDLDYGFNETKLEGFDNMWPDEFVAMFCRTHKRCTPETVVTRIEFAYEDGEGEGGGQQ